MKKAPAREVKAIDDGPCHLGARDDQIYEAGSVERGKIQFCGRIRARRCTQQKLRRRCVGCVSGNRSGRSRPDSGSSVNFGARERDDAVGGPDPFIKPAAFLRNPTELNLSWSLSWSKRAARLPQSCSNIDVSRTMPSASFCTFTNAVCGGLSVLEAKLAVVRKAP